MKLPLVSRTRYRPTNHALAIDGKSVVIAIGLLVAFVVGIVLLVATYKPAVAHHAATPEVYSTEAAPDDGIMPKKPAAGMPQ
jgi:hypothetical protein